MAALKGLRRRMRESPGVADGRWGQLFEQWVGLELMRW
jgi:hypothetical protein